MLVIVVWPSPAGVDMYPATKRIAVPLMSAAVCVCPFLVSSAARHGMRLIFRVALLYIATGFRG